MAIYKDVEPFIKWLEKEIEQFGEPNISIRPVAYGSENALRSVLNKMKELPEADVMEVVRCKDCEHKQELDKYEKRLYIEGCVACTQISPNSDRLVMLPTDFCSCGERSDT